jgi:hypothetical protein
MGVRCACLSARAANAYGKNRQSQLAERFSKRGWAAMTQHSYLFDLDDLLQAQLDTLREARALRPGVKRDEKLHRARSLQKLIESQIQERESLFATRH